MPIKYTVTLTSVGTSSVIVVPKAVLDGFGLKKGQKLQMVVKDDGIYIPLRENTTATITKEKVR
jgi:bifunctional DNA-binding transcriptional regulator/antitoxin component of YhaV-PrlF toxin-antitoxin module